MQRHPSGPSIHRGVSGMCNCCFSVQQLLSCTSRSPVQECVSEFASVAAVPRRITTNGGLLIYSFINFLEMPFRAPAIAPSRGPRIPSLFRAVVRWISGQRIAEDLEEIADSWGPQKPKAHPSSSSSTARRKVDSAVALGVRYFLCFFSSVTAGEFSRFTVVYCFASQFVSFCCACVRRIAHVAQYC